MGYIAVISTILFAHLLAVMSPGPDLIMTMRNSLTYSRKIGIFTAIGIGLGIIIHVFYSIAGLALIISKSIILFNTIKLLGAAYLIYIGIKSLKAKANDLTIEKDNSQNITALSAIKMGFLTNALNPKASIFFLSLFTFIIKPETPFIILLIAGGLMVINTMLWFSFVATFFTHQKIQSKAKNFQNILNKIFGGLLVALGIKVALIEK